MEPPALKATMIGGIGIGGALTGAGRMDRGPRFPPRAMFEVMQTLTALPHLLMALGYAAGLMRLWPRLAPLASGPCWRRRDAALLPITSARRS
jgi:uncharacterized protein